MDFPSVNIVGAHFRGADVKNLVWTLTPGQTLRLEREPDNPHDANAIKAFFEDCHIGYVERGTAAWMAPHLDNGHTVESCTILEVVEGARKNPQPRVSVIVSDNPAVDFVSRPIAPQVLHTDPYDSDDIPF